MGFQKTKDELLLTKISRRRDEIARYMISNARPIEDIKYRETSKYESFEEGLAGTDWKSIKVGDLWGGGKNGWFKLSFDVPVEWKGREVAAYLNFGGESCAYIDGKPFQGIDDNHEEVLLSRSAKGGEHFEIVVDAASSRPWAQDETQPVRFRRAEIATRNPQVQEYWFNLEVLRLLAEELPNDSPRRAKIIYTLNRSVDAFDYTRTDDESLKRSAIRANEILKPLLDCPACPSATNVACHGHSHIDVAWLWPYRETKRKCARTFSSVMRLMEQYPEYIFSQSQAQLYEFTRENFPSLYEEIKERAREGRWDVTGSMWVEADCNLPSGESLVRQILFGKNFFRNEFEIETDVLWLPDVFGYSAALPQILKKAGINYFSTIKINWSQFNRFPYTTFFWQGIDGTRILTHFPPTVDYNAYPEPAKLLEQVRQFREKDRSDWSLLSYGFGDGGGGPDKRHLELLRRSRNLEGLPRCKHLKVSDFFRTIEEIDDYPEWVGELYLEYHRGTYTTQARNKRYNRKAELLYRDAELLSVIASKLGLDYPSDELHRQWKHILCNQFHDVLPGSSINEVYEDTEQMYQEILEVGNSIRTKAMSAITKNVTGSGEGRPVVIFNTLPWRRIDQVKIALESASAYTVLDAGVNEVPSQVENGEISFFASVPSMGYTTYWLINRRPQRGAESTLRVSTTVLENRFFRITLDENGVIASLVHKRIGREVFKAGERGNLLQLFEDKPNDPDAWDIDFFYDDKWEDITSLQSIEVAAEGPVYGAVEMVRRFSRSLLRQRIVIYADSPRIDFVTWVDWHEEKKCLKASFPIDVNASRARYEIQFGNIERPTHRNTTWDFARFEVCAHRWADVSEQGFGVSLLNDCKYGHHVKGSLMRLTLLRSPKFPDPVADIGEHIFIYSLLPHSGDYIEAGTVRHGYQLNVPLQAVVLDQTGAGESSNGSSLPLASGIPEHDPILPSEKSFFSINAENVILETVKRAEKEDAVILRLYECHNQRTIATIRTDIPFRQVYECNLMEDDLERIPAQGAEFTVEFRPFDIRTFKLLG